MSAKPKSKLTFVMGGARSGKSAYAAALGASMAGPRHFLPTAEPSDQDMIRRVAEQRARRGSEWVTHEPRGDLLAGLAAVPPRETVLIDCLALWLTHKILEGAEPVPKAIDELSAALAARTGQRIVVSSEVGWGIVPDNELARAFRDHAGHLHQRLGAMADSVVLVVAGCPVIVK